MEKSQKEAAVYFIQNAGSALVKLIQAVVPEVKKFDKELSKISTTTKKIRYKTNKPKKQKIQTLEQVTRDQSEKQEKPVKSEFKVLS